MPTFFFFAVLLSLPSLAEITLELTSGDYKIEATLTATSVDRSTGIIKARSSFHDECTGTYTIDFTKSERNFLVIFDGLDGPGTGGGCHNESMDIDISQESYEQILDGSKVTVTYRAIRTYGFPRKATVQRI